MHIRLTAEERRGTDENEVTAAQECERKIIVLKSCVLTDSFSITAALTAVQLHVTASY